MIRSRSLAAGLLGIALFIPLAACGDDDDDDSGATGSGSLADQDLSQGTDNPLVIAAVAEYTTYARGQVDALVPAVKTFTDAVRSGNIEAAKAAKAAYAPSREPWERIEPIAALVEEIDGKVDARVDDFANVDDPTFTGWHRIEYLLFAQNTTEGAAAFADRLDADIATLQSQLATLEIPPTAVAIGAAELVEEVSEGKITGEEDRYSGTDLWDFNANVEGAEQVIKALTPALQEADAALLAEINKGFADLRANLDPLRSGSGWQLYCLENGEYNSTACTGTTVDQATVDKLKANLAGLSESLSTVAGALGLQ